MNRLPTKLVVSVIVCFTGLVFADISLAQKGKLTGSVTDEATGDPIPGVTVVLVGTPHGTATGAEGTYFLIGLRPGTYSVRFSFVGYSTKVVEGVLVTSDLTRVVDATLDSQILGGEEVVVTAARPIVDLTQTNSRSVMTSDEISILPVRSLADVIAKSSNSWSGYIRGSQRFETKTIVEGIDVSDVFYQTVAAGSFESYGGDTYASTNKSDRVNPALFDIDPDGISEVSVSTGATEARYVSATGGVVVVNLSEGRGPITGSFSARVTPSIARPGPDSLDFYREDYDGITVEEAYNNAKAAVAAVAATGDEYAAKRLSRFSWTWDKYCEPGGSPGNRDNCRASRDPTLDFRGRIAGSLTDKWHLAANLRFFEEHGYAPNQYDKVISGLLNTTYEISDRTSVSVIGIFEDRGLWGNWNNRDYRDLWRFNLEAVAQNDGGSYLGSVELTQILNDRSFLSVHAYRTYWRDRNGYPDDNGNGFVDPGEHGDFIDFFDLSNSEKYVDVTGSHDSMFSTNPSDAFTSSGIELSSGPMYHVAEPVPYFEDTILETNGARLDYSNQVKPNHFVQLGVEAKFRSIDYKEADGIDGIALNHTDENGDALEPYIPDVWTRRPREFALYASDRVEYGGLIMNLGLRLEAFDRDMELITDHFYPLRRDTVTVQGHELARNFLRRGKSVPMDIFLNPGLGVAHPIGGTAEMYFSYKRSHQFRPYNQMYQVYSGNNSPGRFFSGTDPEIDPIVSDNYEMGLLWEFSPGWGADVSVYTRAIENAFTATLAAIERLPEGEVRYSGRGRHWYITDFGYADSRGVELVLRRRQVNLTGGITLGLTASYTFSKVEASQAARIEIDEFRSTDGETQLPFDDAEKFRYYTVDVRGGSAVHSGYDRRHRGVLRLAATLPAAISIGIRATIESGLRYSPIIVDDVRDRSLRTGPTNHQVDLRVEKQIDFAGRFGVDLYLDVINAFDTNNVVAYDSSPFGRGPFIFQETGVPGERLINYNNGLALYGPARAIYFGSRFRF